MKRKIAKLLSVFLTFIIVLNLILPINIFSASALSDGTFNYEVSGSNATITGYIGASNTVVVPSTISTYTVTTIAAAAFSTNLVVKNLTLPSTVTAIEANAFISADNLETITVDTNNTKYSSENGVLYNYSKSTLIRYPAAKTGDYFVVNSNTNDISQYAFYNVKLLKRLTLPQNLSQIPVACFYNATGLEKVVMQDNVTFINTNAFYGCSNLNSVYFSASIANIATNAFKNCVKLNNLVMPSALTLINENAFYGCTSLSSIIFNVGIQEIKAGAFAGCTSLTKAVFPGTIKSISTSTSSNPSSAFPTTTVLYGNDVNNIVNNFATLNGNTFASIDTSINLWESNVLSPRYFVNGVEKTGLLTDGGNTYYLNSLGQRVVGLVEIGDKTYLFDDNGVLKSQVTVTSISVTAPTKVSYQLNSVFDPTGGTVTYNFSSYPSYTVSLTADMCTNFNTSSTGSKTITVSYATFYSTFTTSFNITVTSLSTLDGIVVNTAPNKTTYIAGETFDKTGMIVYGLYGTDQVVINNASITATPSVLTLGTTNVTLSYGGKTIDQPVTVLANANKTQLAALITTVNALTQANYTKFSWANLQTNLTAANTANATTYISQTNVDTAYNNLNTAYTSLVSIQALNSLIATAKAITLPGEYAPSAAQNLQTQITASDALVALTTYVSDAQVAAQYANLNTAINSKSGPGDVNADGKIDGKDIAAIVLHITKVKLLTGNGLLAADTNKDSVINVKDIAAIVNHITGRKLLF